MFCIGEEQFNHYHSDQHNNDDPGRRSHGEESIRYRTHNLPPGGAGNLGIDHGAAGIRHDDAIQHKLHIEDNYLHSVAELKVAMKSLAEKYGCNAIAIQCWNALQSEIHIMPCAANALLNEEGIPVVCETDIHGAISQLIAEAASMNERRVMFSDWTVRHPDNDNGELLQHCGPWPISVAKEKPTICVPVAFPQNGAVSAEAKHGPMSLVRFDGDEGEYSILLGHARGIDGPWTRGTYVWVEVNNLKRLEAKVVEGPYIHHVAAIHGDVVPVVYEACKYIGVKPDLYDPIEDKVKAYLHGEDVVFDEV